jgi:signal transduction histidine kinase
MAENERRRVSIRIFTYPRRPYRFSRLAREALDERQFSEWFGLMVRAVSHEVSNSVLSLQSLSLKKNGPDCQIVPRLIDEFNLIRSLSEYSRENPPERAITPALARCLEGIPAEELASRAMRIRHIKAIALESIPRFRSALLEAAYEFHTVVANEPEYRFHLVRAVEYGTMLSGYLEKLMTGAFGEKELALPRRISGESSVLEDCAMVAAEAGCRLEISCPPDVGGASVLSDPFLCRLLISNIISNALRACKSAGREPFVELSVGRGDGGRILFRFTDHGAGMEQSVMEKLNSGAAVTTRGEAGQHGIGFSYSRDIASRMGGTLHVEKSSPGAGTSVMLELACCTPPQERLH